MESNCTTTDQCDTHAATRRAEQRPTDEWAHPGVVSDTIEGMKRAGGYVVRDAETDLLTVNREFTASIVIVRYDLLFIFISSTTSGFL